MGFLLQLLLAMAAAAAAELLELEGGGAVGAAVGGLVLTPMPHLLGRLARRLALAGRWRAARRVASVLENSAPLAFAGLLASGWSGWARSQLGASILDWPTPGLAVLLAPYVVLELLAIDARARGLEPPGQRRAGLVRFLRRQFVATSLPIGAYFVISGVIGAFEPARVQLEEVTLYGLLYAAILLALLAFSLPLVIRRAWDTVPLPASPLRDYLLDIAARGGFRFRELLVWNTGGNITNAAIVGFTPRQRIVLMTDALLRDLGPRELAAAFGHEMGHSVRRHPWLFTLWTVDLFLAHDLAAEHLSIPTLPLLIVLGTVWYEGFGFLSRRAELDADLVAFEVTHGPDDLIRALDRVDGGRARWRHGWRHFSIAQRILFLRAVAADARVGRRLRTTLDRSARFGVGALLLLGGLWVWDAVDRMGGQLAWADLRMGRYGEAVERLGPDDPEHLRELALGGQELVAEGVAPTAPALLGRARERAELGDWVTALRDAELAYLLESEAASPVLGWLEAKVAGDLDGAERLAGELPLDWIPLTERGTSDVVD